MELLYGWINNFIILKTRKVTGLKFLRVNCWEINQVTSKCLMDFLEKIAKKVSSKNIYI